MKDSQIKNLSDKYIWTKEWFLDIFLKGLRNDGLQEKYCQEIENLVLEKSPKSFEEFLYLYKKKFKNKSSNDIIWKFFDRLSSKVNSNRNCYLRESPSKTRVIQWPNNQSSKVKNPEHYFNIYEDLFYRDRYPIIDKYTAIGSAGSCFAQRIAHQLQKSGFNYVIEEDDLPSDYPIQDLTKSKFRLAPARIGTLFNTPSMRQMVERGFGYWNPEFILAEDKGKIIDPFRTSKNLYDDYEGFLVDYKKHSAALNKALNKCDVFILTLGLTEAWYFAHSGKYTSISPHKINPLLIRQKNLSVEENIDELEKLYAIYKRHKPSIKFIVSVSPIPLNKTFSKKNHVVCSSFLSKSILRVAAEEFSKNHPDNVFYFPSFETVMYGCKDPWEKDKRHVNPHAVERVMDLFSNMFLVNKEQFKFTKLEFQPEIQTSTIIRIKNLLRPIKRKLFK